MAPSTPPPASSLPPCTSRSMRSGPCAHSPAPQGTRTPHASPAPPGPPVRYALSRALLRVWPPPCLDTDRSPAPHTPHRQASKPALSPSRSVPTTHGSRGCRETAPCPPAHRGFLSPFPCRSCRPPRDWWPPGLHLTSPAAMPALPSSESRSSFVPSFPFAWASPSLPPCFFVIPTRARSEPGRNLPLET